MPSDPGAGNRNRGYAFVHYSDPRSAEAALVTFNGMEIGGRRIKVGRPFQG